MKFTDGQWLLRKGVKASYAAQAYEIKSSIDTLQVLAPTRPIRHRGDTLDGAVLKFLLHSPMPDVIGVLVSHHEGGDPPLPSFDIEISPGYVEVADFRLTSGNLTAEVAKEGWGIAFSARHVTSTPLSPSSCAQEEGELLRLTSCPPKGAAYVEVEGEGSFMACQLSLGVGEQVYGFGERFTPFVKNGQVIETWNEDGGTASEQAYKCIPFYLTNRGYGVFVNHPGKVSFEVASEAVSKTQFSVPGEALEYYVIYGPSPKEILAKYTELTGRPALPPPWSFGLWLSTSFTTDYDEATVTGFIDGMASRDITLSVFHFDCFWMRAFRWCDFQWDPEVFPDPKGMLQRLHEKGLKVSCWINPYIAQASELFNEGKDNGFLVKRQDGSVWQWDRWQAGMGLVDFTNEAACEWFQEKLKALLDDGADALKTDFGERIPTDVIWQDGSDPERMHNYYTYLYNQTVFELLDREKGKGEAVLFARSATVGGQKFPVHWGGDCWSTFESMAESLRGGLSLGLSGFGFWSHDIGGFEGTPPPELFKRWIAFGLLSSHSRLHGSSSYRVPWLFDEEAVDVLRFFTKLKCRLMPYLWSKAVEAHERGVPMMRAMILEFPNDPACEFLDRQYMLGDSLLVAPVFSGRQVQYYVPAGKWTHLLTGETIDGPGWKEEEHGFMSLPLLVRPNTLLATGTIDSQPDYDYPNHVELTPFEVSATSCKVYRLNGELAFEASAKRNGDKVEVSR